MEIVGVVPFLPLSRTTLSLLPKRMPRPEIEWCKVWLGLYSSLCLAVLSFVLLLPETVGWGLPTH